MDKNKLNKNLLTTGGLLMLVVLFLLVNIVSNAIFSSARLDLTSNGLYSLSDGTHNILSNLSEPVTLRFYLSQNEVANLPGIAGYANRVKDLLHEYKRASKGFVVLDIINPEPFSEAEDQAVAYGLQGVPINNATTTFYFGLVGTDSTDKQETIAFFAPDRSEFLEYDLTKLIYQLSNTKQTKIGVMSSLPIMGGAPSFPGQAQSNSLVIIDQIKQLFTLTSLETSVDKIPDDISLLMIVHPKGLGEQTLYAIDQYILGGGRLLAFIDPYAEADNPNANSGFAGMNAPRNSDLGPLLDSWGITMEAGKTAGDISLAKKVQFPRGQTPVIVDYPVWMDLKEANYNNTEVITAKLGNITLATPGILKAKEKASTKFTPLLQTSEKAMAISTASLGMFADPTTLIRNYRTEGKFTLAGRVTGKIISAFPNGKPGGTGDKSKHLAESKESINIILVADTDLLQDRFWVQVQNFIGQRMAIPTAANNSFVVNALDNLTGSNDLINVRNRGNFSRPFTKVKALQQEAEKEFLQKEQVLRQRLTQLEQKIRDLQTKKQDRSSLILSDAQRDEILKFQSEKITLRKELRSVQHELNKNIESLEATMKGMNIFLVPLLVALGGWYYSYSRSRKSQS